MFSTFVPLFLWFAYVPLRKNLQYTQIYFIISYINHRFTKHLPFCLFLYTLLKIQHFLSRQRRYKSFFTCWYKYIPHVFTNLKYWQIFIIIYHRNNHFDPPSVSSEVIYKRNCKPPFLFISFHFIKNTALFVETAAFLESFIRFLVQIRTTCFLHICTTICLWYAYVPLRKKS